VYWNYIVIDDNSHQPDHQKAGKQEYKREADKEKSFVSPEEKSGGYKCINAIEDQHDLSNIKGSKKNAVVNIIHIEINCTLPAEEEDYPEAYMEQGFTHSINVLNPGALLWDFICNASFQGLSV